MLQVQHCALALADLEAMQVQFSFEASNPAEEFVLELPSIIAVLEALDMHFADGDDPTIWHLGTSAKSPHIALRDLQARLNAAKVTAFSTA
jgi:hypothetical protein